MDLLIKDGKKKRTVKDVSLYELTLKGLVVLKDGTAYGKLENAANFGLYYGTISVVEKRKILDQKLNEIIKTDLHSLFAEG